MERGDGFVDEERSEAAAAFGSVAFFFNRFDSYDFVSGREHSEKRAIRRQGRFGDKQEAGKKGRKKRTEKKAEFRLF